MLLNFNTHVVQEGTIWIDYTTDNRPLVMDLICKEMGYERHIVESGMNRKFFKLKRLQWQGILSKFACPKASKSFSDCTFIVGKSKERPCWAVACKPQPGESSFIVFSVV